MQNLFVTSDTWFNRLLPDDGKMTVLEKNENIINKWNSTVNPEDIVYVLGGFGISDLFNIVCRLNGEIHFLNNYVTNDERMFIIDMMESVIASSDNTILSRIFLEEDQIMILGDYDCILSYFQLADWAGKKGGTFCFHGLNGNIDMKDNNISCMSSKWKNCPLNVVSIMEQVKDFKEIYSNSNLG